MHKKDEVKKIIYQQWLLLSDVERKDYFTFAMKMHTQHGGTFKCSGDPYQTIMGWVSNFK